MDAALVVTFGPAATGARTHNVDFALVITAGRTAAGTAFIPRDVTMTATLVRVWAAALLPAWTAQVLEPERSTASVEADQYAEVVHERSARVLT